MNDDMEQVLGQLTPRGVRPELRSQILAAVEAQLQTEPASPWLRRCALAVAASLLAGIGMNIWASKESERHLAQLYGPPPVSKRAMEVAKMIEGVTDAQTAQWVYQRLAVPRAASPDALAKHYLAMHQLIKELQTDFKGSYHETPQKDPQMDRDRPGRARGDTSSGQRSVCVDYRYTA
jgi:hypothetical protein